MATSITSTTIEALRALGDPTRMEIAQRLGAEELCVCHLVDDLDLGQPLVSHHLRVLKEAGLVEAHRHSYWTYYRLAPETLNAVVDELAVLRGQSFSRHLGALAGSISRKEGS